MKGRTLQASLAILTLLITGCAYKGPDFNQPMNFEFTEQGTFNKAVAAPYTGESPFSEDDLLALSGLPTTKVTPMGSWRPKPGTFSDLSIVALPATPALAIADVLEGPSPLQDPRYHANFAICFIPQSETYTAREAADQCLADAKRVVDSDFRKLFSAFKEGTIALAQTTNLSYAINERLFIDVTFGHFQLKPIVTKGYAPKSMGGYSAWAVNIPIAITPRAVDHRLAEPIYNQALQNLPESSTSFNASHSALIHYAFQPIYSETRGRKTHVSSPSPTQ